MVFEFDATKFFLGSLCKRGHDWNGTGQSLRYVSSPMCAYCFRKNPGAGVGGNKAKDLTGHRFGRLLVLRQSEKISKTPIRWNCLCDCGEKTTVAGNSLKSGRTTSCGCAAIEVRKKSKNKTHGMTKTATYRSCVTMIARCRNPKDPSYSSYGDRGIDVCDRWLKFENFLADMGERPEGTSLDRIENNEGYSPGNCKWSTPRQQAQNRRSSRMITCNGQTLNLSEWVRLREIPKSTILNRLKRGSTVEQALGFEVASKH